MHRAFSRVIRGTYRRKWRENECTVSTGEDAKNSGNSGSNNANKHENFAPDSKYTVFDAVGWTTGLVVAYEFTHRRRQLRVEEVTSLPYQHAANFLLEVSKCPCVWPKKAVSQPILSQSVVELKSPSDPSSSLFKKPSIDITPFLKEERGICWSDFEQLKPVTNDDEDLVQFCLADSEELTSNSSQVPIDNDNATTEKLNTKAFSGDILGVLGAYKFLKQNSTPVNKNNTRSDFFKNYWDNEKFRSTNSLEQPPLTALELMEKGSELGSSRALYNIGVAYERSKDLELAKEYYRKAADLGHPLATYNTAVHLLKDGKEEGWRFMKTAAEFGVPEAKSLLRDT